ncbi:hypothetical protein CJ483_03380 [Bacillus sp. PK3_68]|nr:hypothetical protein CJ483_03380 [Bacillus sp. PK3_68]
MLLRISVLKLSGAMVQQKLNNFNTLLSNTILLAQFSFKQLLKALLHIKCSKALIYHGEIKQLYYRSTASIHLK